jgi:hypothetical protein
MSMTGRIFDYPTRLLVASEDNPDEEYLVDLVEWELGLNEHGVMTFNGSCQCEDYLYRWLPRLKKPENMGKVFRCKHIRWAREHALEFMLPKLKDADPNIHEKYQS